MDVSEMTNEELLAVAKQMQAELNGIRAQRAAGEAAHSAASGGEPLASDDTDESDEGFQWSALARPFDPEPDVAMSVDDAPEHDDRGRWVTPQERFQQMMAAARERVEQ